MGRQLILTDLATLLAERAGISPDEASALLKALSTVTFDAVLSDRMVEIPYIGVLEINRQGEPEMRVDSSLASAINEPFEFFEPVAIAEEPVPETTSTDHSPEACPGNAPLPNNGAAPGRGEPRGAIDERDIQAVTDAESPKPEAPLHTHRTEPAPPHCDPMPQQTESEKTEIQPVPVSQSTTEPQHKLNPEPQSAPVAPQPIVVEVPRQRNCCRTLYLVLVIVAIVTAYLLGLYTPEIKGWIHRITAPSTPVPEIIYVEATPTKRTDAAPLDTIQRPEAETSRAKEHLDTVRVRYYITHMAKRYYGNDNFWSYIYKENEDKLGNPDLTQPGTVVVIPPAEKYGIDASDPASVRAAKQLGVEIYSRFR